MPSIAEDLFDEYRTRIKRIDLYRDNMRHEFQNFIKNLNAYLNDNNWLIYISNDSKCDFIENYNIETLLTLKKKSAFEDIIFKIEILFCHENKSKFAIKIYKDRSSWPYFSDSEHQAENNACFYAIINAFKLDFPKDIPDQLYSFK